ncbi:MAG: DUF3592 domain-containing protein [Terracidiphilus sp.]
MILELYERLRGYDKWVETQAKVESSDVDKSPVTNRFGQVVSYRYSAGDILTWVDSHGENQYANFDVGENSPLYQLLGGESVTIRYDPASPDRFYYRDLLKTRVNSVLRTTLAVLIVLACVILGGWLLFRS